jgi:acyl-CoA thioesterase-1
MYYTEGFFKMEGSLQYNGGMDSVNHRKPLILLGILFCCFLFGCDSSVSDQASSSSSSPTESSSPSPTALKPANARTQSQEILDRPRIVAFGNSLTAGLGVSQDQAYPAVLQRRLDQEGYAYRVINAGVSGDTTAGGLRRLNWVLKNRPSIVIVELGANDGLRGHPLEETFQNLENIIQGFQSAGVTVVLTGMQIPPNYGLAYTTQFSAMFSKLADKYHLPFMPFFLEGVAAHPALNQADGLHPTPEGYEIIVQNLMALLKEVLHQPHSNS